MAEPGPLRYAVIEITNRCNLRCPHCASSSGQARADELSLEELRGIVHHIAELGGEEITIIGGEALLREDWLEVCRAVRQAGMRLLLLSNGVLLARDERALGALRELEPYLVGISIDGASPASYRRLRGVDAFGAVVDLCHRLVADGHPHVNAISTFWHDNLGEFWELARLFADSDITWQVQIANRGGQRFSAGQFLSRADYAWLAQQMREILVQDGRLTDGGRIHLKPMDDFGYFPLDPALARLHQGWHGCIAGIELCGIRSDGDLLGCLSLGDEFVEGNVRVHDLRQLWRAEGTFRRFRHKEELLSGHCARCPHALRCRAGCSAIAWSATGELGQNPYCLRQLETEAILSELAAASGRPR
jgi:radical SAM protein with 4Fe4S-binding SPASM domain